jgi:simple sugar transport system permease protein
MKPLRQLNSRNIYYITIFIVVFLLISTLIPAQFLGMRNLQSMAFQVPEFGILALGMMVVMLTGGIDLSIVANANLAGIMAAIFMAKATAAIPLGGALPAVLVAVFVALAIGCLAGMVNGMLISRLGIPPILATLGTSKLFEGIGTVTTGGQPLRGFSPIIQYIANGKIGVVPFSLLLFLTVVCIMTLVTKKTPFGFSVYMVGSNPRAARYAGLNNKAILLKTYIIAGLMAGIAALLMMSRFNSVKVGYGNSYVLETILVVILGGVNPDGGEGDVWGVLFGILTLQVIASGFNILGFTDYMRNVIYGGMLIAVLVILSLGPKVMPLLRSTLRKP